MSSQNIKLLKELKTNLQNSIIKNKLKKEGVEKEYIDLQNSLDVYIENIDFIKSDDFKNELSQKLKQLIDLTNNETIQIYKTKFVNLALYIIENTPKDIKIDTQNEKQSSNDKAVPHFQTTQQNGLNLGFNVQPNKKTVTKEKTKKEYESIQDPKFQIKKKSEIKPSFGVEELATTLSDIIIKQPDESGMMIGVFGRWGRGKTYLADKTWEQISSKKEDFIRVDFSAWKYQDTKSSWAYLYEVFLEKYFENDTTIPKAKKIYKLNQSKYGTTEIYTFFGLILFSFCWLFCVDKTELASWLLSVFGIVVLFKIFFFYLQHKNSAIGLFKKYFSKTSFKDILGFQSEIQDEIKILLQTWIPTIDKDKKIVLFVDDLDRCSNDQMINVLDGLRLILDDEEIHSRLIIITSIDEEILQKAFYSQKYLLDDKEVSKRNYFKEYLEKVFLVGIKLDVLDEEESKEYFDKLVGEQTQPNNNQTTQQSSVNIGFDVQLDKKQPSKEEPDNKNNTIESFEITQDEKELIEDFLKNLNNPTPRKIRIFYYKYLIAKRLYSNDKEIEDLINCLVNITNCDDITSSNQSIQKVVKMVGVL